MANKPTAGRTKAPGPGAREPKPAPTRKGSGRGNIAAGGAIPPNRD